jgi:hypothetical protein
LKAILGSSGGQCSAQAHAISWDELLTNGSVDVQIRYSLLQEDSGTLLNAEDTRLMKKSTNITADIGYKFVKLSNKMIYLDVFWKRSWDANRSADWHSVKRRHW